MTKKENKYIYIGSKQYETLRDTYVRINDLLEYSVMVYGGDKECGSRELGIRKEYDKMLENLEQLLKQ
tara:strand:+ start:100 stop:303 length:204 start_codon:yes stop_codon:yes gene_type:complete